jgi:hypothetical protein
MHKLENELKKYSLDEITGIKRMPTLKHKVDSLEDDFQCPGCGDYGTNEFIQAECLHVFCVICYKSSKKSCPLCFKEFNEMHNPHKMLKYRDLFSEIKCIGRGSFGSAYLVTSKQNEFFIAKKISLFGIPENQRKAAMLEADLLKYLSSQYIVQYKNCFHENDTMIIIMEYCEHGDLSY